MRIAVALVFLLAAGCRRQEAPPQQPASAKVKGTFAVQGSATQTTPSFSLSVVPRLYATAEPFGEPLEVPEPFDAATLRYVGYEVGWPPAGRQYTMHGCVVALLSTGVVRLPREQSRIAGADVRHAGGFGYKVPGLWVPGQYELRCRTEGYEVEPRRFRVTGRSQGTAGVTIIPSRSAIEKGTVETIKFMEQSYDPPPIGQRRYGGTFRGARYIGVEVKLKLEPLQKPRPLRFRCHWFNDGGEAIGGDARDLTIPPGKSEYYMWLSWGNREGTFWQPGTYCVECDADGALIAAAFFRIVR